MSGINPGVFLAVCRMLVDFRDDIGNSKTISGTGFWVRSREKDCFVTNRHNVDPAMKLGPTTKFRLEKVSLQLRLQITPGNWRPDTCFAGVENLQSCLRLHASADVAALVNPSLLTENPMMGHSTFTLDELGTREFLMESVNPMDVASFVGFPGRDGKAWWDKKWNLPISRTAHIASWPRVAFTHDSIPTSDVLLVSGLSFSGSSGSPVISHEKGIKVGSGLSGSGYVEPKILGIMSGHWWDEEPQTGTFFHSGLSYFTRVTSIRELVEA
jgi:hypothetical protein